MPALDELFSAIPTKQFADALGADEGQVAQAIQALLPALVGGMQANAADPAGAASLTKAISQHDPSLVQGGVNLSDVDTADGSKIVRHVFGDNEEAVVQRLSGAQPLAGGLVQKLLPMLAPIVLSWLAGKVFGGGGQAPAPAPAPQQDSGGGIFGDILDKITGKDRQPEPAPQPFPQQQPGQAQRRSAPGEADGGFIDDLLDKVSGRDAPQQRAPQQQTQQPGGIDLGSILGDLLGGGSGGQGGGIDIGSILGDLLGGGRR